MGGTTELMVQEKQGPRRASTTGTPASVEDASPLARGSTDATV